MAAAPCNTRVVRNPHWLAQSAAGVALLCASSPCRGESGLPTTLDFRAGPDCPSQASFVAKINARTPIEVVDQGAALRLQISLSSDAPSARGVLGTGSAGSGDFREVSAPSCEQVADALALIAALLVERTKRERAAAPPPPPPPSAVVRAAPTLPTAAPRPRPRARRVMLGAKAALSRPITRETLTGAGLSLLVDTSLSWWLSIAYLRNDALSAPRNARLAVGAATVGIGPPALRFGPFDFAAAFAGQGAFITASGVGVDVSTSARRSEWSLGALSRLNVEAMPGGLVFLELGAFAPLFERRFSTLSPDKVVAETAPISPEFGLGFSLSL